MRNSKNFWGPTSLLREKFRVGRGGDTVNYGLEKLGKKNKKSSHPHIPKKRVGGDRGPKMASIYLRQHPLHSSKKEVPSHQNSTQNQRNGENPKRYVSTKRGGPSSGGGVNIQGAGVPDPFGNVLGE